MRLPVREYCFACEQTDKSTIWSSDTLDLIACGKCRSEWLEGYYPGGEAYCYADYAINSLMQRYHIARAFRFRDYLQQFPIGRDLLDIGCGTGEFCCEASKLGWNPIGIELTEDAAALARARTGLPILSGNLTNEVLFPPASFDMITLWGVLEHVSDPEALLRACIRLLRPNGLILLETPNVLGLFRFVAQLLLKLTLGHFEKPFIETLGAGHISWYSPLGLQTTCQRLGLRVMDMRASRNYTGILLDRFSHLFFPVRVLFQTATALLNYLAIPVGRPNQIIVALSRT